MTTADISRRAAQLLECEMRLTCALRLAGFSLTRAGGFGTWSAGQTEAGALRTPNGYDVNSGRDVGVIASLDRVQERASKRAQAWAERSGGKGGEAPATSYFAEAEDCHASSSATSRRAESSCCNPASACPQARATLTPFCERYLDARTCAVCAVLRGRRMVALFP